MVRAHKEMADLKKRRELPSAKHLKDWRLEVGPSHAF